MASPDLPDAAKAELARLTGPTNPVLLQQEVHQTVSALMELNQRKDLMRHQSFADAALENI
jgi:hypothetical protein